MRRPQHEPPPSSLAARRLASRSRRRAAATSDGCVGGDDGQCLPPAACPALAYAACAAPALRAEVIGPTRVRARRRPEGAGRRRATTCWRTISSASCSTRPTTRTTSRPAAAPSWIWRPLAAGRVGRSDQRHLPRGRASSRATPSTTRAPPSSIPQLDPAAPGAYVAVSSAATSRATRASPSSPATSCAPASRASASAPTSTTARPIPTRSTSPTGSSGATTASLPFVPGRGARVRRARRSICCTSTRPGGSGRFWRRARSRRPTRPYAAVSVRSRAGRRASTARR